MNAESLFGALYITIGLTGFCVLLVLGEVISNLLFRIPAFRAWFDRINEGLPNWDEDDEW